MQDQYDPGKPNDRFLSHVFSPRNVGSVLKPSGAARGVGDCGDSVEVSLQIKLNKITKVRCLPEGCVYTQVCASALSELVNGLSIDQALELNPEDITRVLGGLPDDHLHCARLAVNTLGEAIDDYYLKSTKDMKDADL